LTVNTSQPTINFVKPAALAYGSNLSSVLPTVATNGPTTIPGTFSYTVTLSGGKPVNVTSATVLEAGSYTLAVTFTPTDTTDYQVVSESAVLAVNKASAAIKLTSSVSSVFAKNPVTFTATVSPTIGTPGGTVSFYDGTTRLGAANLTAGVATYITSTLSANVHSITAVYSGDNNFNTVTSAALSEQVQDLSLTLTSGGATTATAVPGGQAVYPLIISPLAGTKFPGVVTLTLSGLPDGIANT
jgi:hypothetical protein